MSTEQTGKCTGSPRFWSRRDFVWQLGGGLGGIALADLLRAETPASAERGAHHAGKAKRVLQLFMSCGVSQVDSFDYKPALAKYDGQEVGKIAGADDVAAAQAYCAVAERLLFDAKPPKDMAGALPGGNALALDWRLLAGTAWPIPWLLSGGLDADNLAEAVRVSGARAVDVSSGVEDAPGTKNPDKIRAFLSAAKAL